MTLTIDNTLLQTADLVDVRHLLAVRALGKLSGASYVSEVLADGPSGYWRLGEASGTIAADSAGNDNDGTYSGSPTLGAAGLLLGDSDTAVTFDGVDDYVTINGLLGNLGSSLGTVTVEFWIKTNTAASSILVLFNGSGNTACEVDLNRDADNTNSAGKTGFAVVDSAGNWGGFHIAANIYDNARHHVVFQLTSAATPAAACWVDGSSVTVTTGATTVPLVAAFENFDGTYSRIGGRPPVDYIAATLDEVAVYPTRLSSARVLAHYQAGTTRPTPTANDLANSTSAAGQPLPLWRQELADALSLADSLLAIAP